MCGICAGIGEGDQIKNVIAGLKKLDYRGYDSSGVAFLKGEKLEVVKSVGAVKNLEKKLPDTFANIAIGHTRWATHGQVTEENAHPHLSHDGQMAIVHNGIIENFEELKKNFDFAMTSQTDTEVFVDLIASQEGDPLEKMIAASKLVSGSYSVALLCRGEEKIYLAKQGSPLMVGIGEKGCLVASDSSVFDSSFEQIFCMEDGEFAVVEPKNVVFYDKNCKKIENTPKEFEIFDFDEAQTQEKYFMLKEIKEQPIVLRKTFFKYFNEGVQIDFEEIKKFKSFHFVACGTAYHACLVGAKYLQDFCKKDCKVSVASEFRYAGEILSKSCLYVFVSQSGETADTIASARLVKDKGCKVLCVTNVPYCSLNSLADYILPTFAGREVAVASTKAYTAQVFTLLIFALALAGKDEKEMLKKFVLNFEVNLPDEELLKQIFAYKKIFFIGRGQDYFTSLEGALKLKEIAYLNCLGIQAGELKHGTLALIDEETLVIAISTTRALLDKTKNNIIEAKARGAKVLIVSQYQQDIEDVWTLALPQFGECFMPIVSIVPLQYLAFEYAIKQGFSPDKPRNLAKSVTVE